MRVTCSMHTIESVSAMASSLITAAEKWERVAAVTGLC